jgi:hypothetical protein
MVMEYYSNIVIMRYLAWQALLTMKGFKVVKKPRHCCSEEWLAAVVSWTPDRCQLIQQQLVISTE